MRDGRVWDGRDDVGEVRWVEGMGRGEVGEMRWGWVDGWMGGDGWGGDCTCSCMVVYCSPRVDKRTANRFLSMSKGMAGRAARQVSCHNHHTG